MNFGTLAKECLEAAEALKKVTFSDKEHHWGFQRSHLQKNSDHRNGNQFNGHGGESHGWQASGNKAKKTTRQHTECFSLYTNVTDFIKSCSTHSYDRHTNTLHTGSHQHHEPVNNMPKTGQVSSTLYNKLESANSRTMGTPNCGWISTIELIAIPYHVHVPHQIRRLPENKVQITMEV